LSAIVGDENILCEHHLRTQRTSVRRFDPYLLLEWLKIARANSISISHQFENVSDPSQMRRGHTGTDRRTLSIATGDYLAGGSAGCENQALSLWPQFRFSAAPPAPFPQITTRENGLSSKSP